MKKSTKIHPKLPSSPAASASADRKKLIGMGIALALVVIAFGYAQYQKAQLREQEPQVESAPKFVVERVVLPEIDVATIEDLVADSKREDQVILERAALDELMPIARNLTVAHFEAMDAELLANRAAIDAVLADPAAHRCDAFTARGWIVALRKRMPGGGRPAEYHGRLVLDDGSSVYFITADTSEDLTRLEYGRVDGLLLKTFNDEDPDEPGKWIQAPLLVGPEVTRSYSPLGEVTELRPGDFANVTDDDIERGISGLPHREYWRLLAFAADPASDEVDWANAMELDKLLVDRMLADGSEFRAEPFRLPPTQVMGVWTERAGENPARFDEITKGWIGSWTWTGEAKVLRFAMPPIETELERGDLVTGRGFFLKNLAYQPDGGGMRLASLVVMDSVELFVPPVNKSIDHIWLGVIGGMIALAGVIVTLLIRDRRRSEELNAKLRDRRRRRRRELSPKATS